MVFVGLLTVVTVHGDVAKAAGVQDMKKGPAFNNAGPCAGIEYVVWG
jgi:hypothetical protein